LKPKTAIRRMAVLTVLGASYLGAPPRYNSPQFRWLERSGKTILSPSRCDVAHRPKTARLAAFSPMFSERHIDPVFRPSSFRARGPSEALRFGIRPRMRNELMQEG